MPNYSYRSDLKWPCMAALHGQLGQSFCYVCAKAYNEYKYSAASVESAHSLSVAFWWNEICLNIKI